MHIPDGYISPQTAVIMYGAALPFWYHASRRVKELLRGQATPLIAIFAAFSFIVQMLNIPVPGGTTAHATGAALMAVVLGPWAAVIGVSTALVIQALFFGDGGITAIGANCFNMAVALPLTSYAVYRVLAGKTPSPRRRTIAAAIAGYVGINVAGLLTGLELGIQPLLWSENGRALYSPYGLESTIPAMALVHLTLAGFAEAAMTGLVIAYLLRSHPSLLAETAEKNLGAGGSLGKMGWSLVGLLGALVIITPLGLLAPGGADFEWGVDEVQEMIGYAPQGLAELEEVWRFAPLPGYQTPSISPEAGLFEQSMAYIFSAVAGIAILFIIFFIARIWFLRNHRPAGPTLSGKQ
jgi:cobalt/nickel transport system permease protein